MTEYLISLSKKYLGAEHVPAVVIAYASAYYGRGSAHLVYTIPTDPTADGYVPTDARARFAESIEHSFTLWMEGEEYGIVSCAFDKDGQPTQELDAVWGFLGSDYAIQARNELVEDMGGIGEPIFEGEL